ncbi:DNA polymerase III subunit delta [bacterium C-53]|nr:DNA polymerase III subunit delta [Lachnospiraceae bacterium]NBI03681.1 DNA polymerase III subunit delta [Lachnospiraceae bacterium]RKJ09241.1 DNA polymerase III subunit delta [bacterium C-53]
MKSIDQDIKSGEFSRIYLLYGEEAYLRRSYKNKLKNALVSEGDTMNYAYFEGKFVNPKAVIDLAETMPFLAGHRVIVIENSGFFKSSCEELASYLTDVPESTVIIFVESEADKRGKMYKVVKAHGRAVEMPAQKEDKLKAWAAGILKREGRNIRETTMNLFLTKTGTDMENIENELEKLICYTAGRDIIEDEDVEAVCTVRVQNHIFDMVNAIAEKKQEQAFRLYYDLLTLKEPPMRILFLIARQFNLLLQVKELGRSIRDTRVISEKTGLHGFVVGKYVAQAKRFQTETLRKAVEDCVAAEEAVKTGKMNDVMSVELLIVNYTS